MASAVEKKLSGFNDIAILLARILDRDLVSDRGLQQVQGAWRVDHVS